jgi:hypothetical protein
MRHASRRVLIIAPALREWTVMNDVAGRIEELEVKAAESALIADLTTDWGVRTYNSRLARELRQAADLLRRRGKIVRGEGELL